MMVVFMEAVGIMLLLHFGYNVIQGRQDLFSFSKTFGIAVMIVGFLVLPPALKAWIMIIALMYFYLRRTGKSKTKTYTRFLKE